VKHTNVRIASSKGLIFAALILLAFSAKAYCQPEGTTTVLLQQSPVNGGTVTPGVGVHNVTTNMDITLTAIPQQGYQFVYWLGDVSDPTLNTTTAYIDAPKVIIAVFERIEYEFLAACEMITSRAAGGGSRTGPDYARQGGGGIGGKRPPKWRPPTPKPDTKSDDFPVPDDNESDDFPVPEPIPEPATIALLGLGALVLVRKPKIKFSKQSATRYSRGKRP
jgi:hypothetical protein